MPRPNYIGFNQGLGGMANAFAQRQGQQKQFQDAAGNIPAVLTDMVQVARSKAEELGRTYQELRFSQRLETVKAFRTFVKDTVRKLFDAYKTEHPKAA